MKYFLGLVILFSGVVNLLWFNGYNQKHHFQEQKENDVHMEVIYKVKVNEKEFKVSSNIEVLERVKQLHKIIPFIEFELVANREESVFKPSDIMNSDFSGTHSLALSSVGGKDTYYNNQEINLVHKTFFGETMNVEIEQVYDWKITAERKEIMGYSCFKATSSYLTIDKNAEPEEVDVFVWFTPEINIPAGPLGFNNLPGLVLEATKNSKYTFYASQINFNPRKKAKIEKPKALKTISEKEFEIILADKLEKIKNGGF